MTSLCQKVDSGCLRRHATSRLPESLSRIYSGSALFLVLSRWHFQKCPQFQPGWIRQQWLEEACRMADTNAIWKMKSSHAKFIWQMGAAKRKDTWENESFKSIVTWFQKAQVSIFCLSFCLPVFLPACFSVCLLASLSPQSLFSSLKISLAKPLVRTHARSVSLPHCAWLTPFTRHICSHHNTFNKLWEKMKERKREREKDERISSDPISLHHCPLMSLFCSKLVSVKKKAKKNQQIGPVLEKEWAHMLTVVLIQAKQSPLHPPACVGPALWEVCAKSAARSAAKSINHAVSHRELQTTKRIHRWWYRMMIAKREEVPVNEETGWEGRTARLSCKCSLNHVMSYQIVSISLQCSTYKETQADFSAKLTSS